MPRPENWKEIRPKYPYIGYPSHKDGAVARWEEAVEIGATTMFEAIKGDMETLLAYASNNDQCDDEEYDEQDKIAQRWKLGEYS